MLTVRPVEAHPGCKMGKESEQDKTKSRDTRSEVSVGPRLEKMEAGSMVKGSGGKADRLDKPLQGKISRTWRM